MRLRTLILATLAMTILFALLFTGAMLYGNQVACGIVGCAG